MTGFDSWACTNVIPSGYVVTMFHPTYDDARAAFRSMSADAGGTLHAWEIIPSETGEAEGADHAEDDAVDEVLVRLFARRWWQ